MKRDRVIALYGGTLFRCLLLSLGHLEQLLRVAHHVLRVVPCQVVECALYVALQEVVFGEVGGRAVDTPIDLVEALDPASELSLIVVLVNSGV